MPANYRLFGQRGVSEEKETGRAVERGRRWVLTTFAVVLGLLVLMMLLPGRDVHAQATVIATVPVGTGPVGVGVNPITNRIYVANSPPSNNVSVIDGTTNAVISTISTLPAEQRASLQLRKLFEQNGWQ